MSGSAIRTIDSDNFRLHMSTGYQGNFADTPTKGHYWRASAGPALTLDRWGLVGDQHLLLVQGDLLVGGQPNHVGGGAHASYAYRLIGFGFSAGPAASVGMLNLPGSDGRHNLFSAKGGFRIGSADPDLNIELQALAGPTVDLRTGRAGGQIDVGLVAEF